VDTRAIRVRRLFRLMVAVLIAAPMRRGPDRGDSMIRESPLVRRIREAAIGDDMPVAGPYGVRRLTYADHTASGRSLAFIEDQLRRAVLPWYANTHTEASATGR